MRTVLRISILLNCALLGCLTFSTLNGRRTRNLAQEPAKTDDLRSVPESVPSSPVASPTTEAKPFRWSQIESANYGSYIANLRAVGCPEQTIRDIITAEVDGQYAARRQPLEARLASSTIAGRVPAEGELRELRRQEASTISALLAAPLAATNSTSALAVETPAFGSVRQEPPNTVLTSQAFQNMAPLAPGQGKLASGLAPGSPPSNAMAQKPPATISVPLVFHEVDPSVLTLNPRQVQVINDLRQKFTEEVGGPGQDPTDPSYAERWQASQPEVDVDLWSMLGINAWQAHQIAAWAESHAQSSPGH